MRHRIFTAISLPENVKKELDSYQKKWPELPIRWTKKDNLHITLDFLGSVSNDQLFKILQDTKELALKRQPFDITLNKICYGPLNKMPSRMVWAVGEKVEELDIFPHITLGRINAWEFRKIELEERPEVNEEINLTFEVSSIEVMESQLKRGGPEYTILESFPLKLN